MPTSLETRDLSDARWVELGTIEGSLVCERCEIADTFRMRLRGLLGRDELEPGHGLLLRPCSSVHTAFMRFPIDVAMLDRNLAVVGLATGLRPWRLAGRRGTRAVLELAAGEIERRGLAVGDRLVLPGSATHG